MAAVELADAEERLRELIDRVAGGETVEILRDGHPVALLSPPDTAENRDGKTGRNETGRKQPIDFDRLKAIRDQMPPQPEDAGTFMRRLRDAERY